MLMCQHRKQIGTLRNTGYSQQECIARKRGPCFGLYLTLRQENRYASDSIIPQRNREACVDKFEAMQMFVRGVEKKSFSAVAKERGIGQPAVSKQISALEDELGTELIQRTSRSLALTEPGRDFWALHTPLDKLIMEVPKNRVDFTSSVEFTTGWSS